MGDTYRDCRGRFSSERGATFKQSGDKQFVRLFGMWAEMKPVTPESFQAATRRVIDAQTKALAESGNAEMNAYFAPSPKVTTTP